VGDPTPAYVISILAKSTAEAVDEKSKPTTTTDSAATPEKRAELDRIMMYPPVLDQRMPFLSLL
jgi:hypothetical protein